MRSLLALLLLAAGCPICGDGAIEVVSGPADGRVRGGDVLHLRARYDGDVFAGAPGCGGFWYVNQVEGGDAASGTIDDCGVYRAPAQLAPGLVEVRIEASDWELRGGCADCCPYAERVLLPVR